MISKICILHLAKRGKNGGDREIAISERTSRVGMGGIGKSYSCLSNYLRKRASQNDVTTDARGLFELLGEKKS